MGFGIHAVKLTTSIIYLLQPLVIYLYVKHNYCIDRNVTYKEEPIKQKWNGIAQHVASVVLDSTDIVVLTVFDTLASVSIYSVYFLVVKGIKQLFLSMTNGIQSLMGELLAKKDIKELNNLFGWTEWVIHTGTVFVFGVAAITIVPFVKVYTKGVIDVDYVQPLFAILLVLANAGHCLRLPYNLLILAAGHYKQTQNNYIIAAIMNITISVIAVNYLGLVGVAIGTLCAMFYQTVWMAVYDSRNIIKWPLKNFIKQVVVDVVTVAAMAVATLNISMGTITYFSWGMYVILIGVISAGVMLVVNSLFYRSHLLRIWKSIVCLMKKILCKQKNDKGDKCQYIRKQQNYRS